MGRVVPIYPEESQVRVLSEICICLKLLRTGWLFYGKFFGVELINNMSQCPIGLSLRVLPTLSNRPDCISR